MGFTNSASPVQPRAGITTAGNPYVEFGSPSRWGLTVDGTPYYAPGGADPSDAATPQLMPDGTVDLQRL